MLISLGLTSNELMKYIAKCKSVSNFQHSVNRRKKREKNQKLAAFETSHFIVIYFAFWLMIFISI